MISDERLREAARKVEESMLASLPDPEECKVPPPPEIERKIEKRIRHANHPIRHRVMKAVACFLLVVLLGGGSVLTLSADARAVFVGWVRDIYQSYETWFSYHYVGGNDTISENVSYRPTWIPKGYTEQEVLELSAQTYVDYKNDLGSKITFGYSLNTESTNIFVEHDGIIASHVLVGDIPADLYVDPAEDESAILMWTDEQANTIFWIIAPLDSNDLIKIAESVEKEIQEK